MCVEAIIFLPALWLQWASESLRHNTGFCYEAKTKLTKAQFSCFSIHLGYFCCDGLQKAPIALGQILETLYPTSLVVAVAPSVTVLPDI